MMAKSNIVEINLERLHYLLRLFSLSEEEFMVMLNSGYKRELSREEVFTKDMSISLLKRIDKIFVCTPHWKKIDISVTPFAKDSIVLIILV